MRAPESPESAQSLRCGEVDGRLSKSTLVLTQRLFLVFSEVEVRVDGVFVVSRRRDAVDAPVRASRGGFVLSRRFHDISRRLVQQDVDEQKRREVYDQKLAKLKQMAPTQC